MKLHHFQAIAAGTALGLVPMMIVDSFAPYERDQIAGFPADEAYKLFIRGHAVPFEIDPSDFADEEGEGGPVLEPINVEIPEDWESLHHLTKRSLAGKISGAPVANKEDAGEIITAELKRRADAAAETGGDA